MGSLSPLGAGKFMEENLTYPVGSGRPSLIMPSRCPFSHPFSPKPSHIFAYLCQSLNDYLHWLLIQSTLLYNITVQRVLAPFVLFAYLLL